MVRGMTNKELADDLEKLNIKFSKNNILHAIDDAIMGEATRRIREAFEDDELEELKRLFAYHRRTADIGVRFDFTENPVQFKVLRKLDIFKFHCEKAVDVSKGESGCCDNPVTWLTNPHSEIANALFMKIIITGISQKQRRDV